MRKNVLRAESWMYSPGYYPSVGTRRSVHPAYLVTCVRAGSEQAKAQPVGVKIGRLNGAIKQVLLNNANLEPGIAQDGPEKNGTIYRLDGSLPEDPEPQAARGHKYNAVAQNPVLPRRRMRGRLRIFSVVSREVNLRLFPPTAEADSMYPSRIGKSRRSEVRRQAGCSIEEWAKDACAEPRRSAMPAPRRPLSSPPPPILRACMCLASGSSMERNARVYNLPPRRVAGEGGPHSGGWGPINAHFRSPKERLR